MVIVGEDRTLIRTILNRLKAIEGVSTDSELAVPLGMEKRNLASYKERDSVPWEKLFTYCRRNRISLEWLVNGRGPQSSVDMVAEPGAIYNVSTDQDAVYTIAGQVSAALGAQPPPEKISEVIKLLHREQLQTGQPPSPEKVRQFVKLL